MDINEVRRRVARDLSDRFPNPSWAQQQVIAAALRSLQSLDQVDVAGLGSWRDTSFLGMRFDGDRRDAPQSIREPTGGRRDSMEIARSNYTQARQRRNLRNFNRDSL